jgi:hypothetical protein
MMSKKTWVRWGVLVTASTVAALQIGACIAESLLPDMWQPGLASAGCHHGYPVAGDLLLDLIADGRHNAERTGHPILRRLAMSKIKTIWMGLAAVVCGSLLGGCPGGWRIWTAILNEEIWG